MYKVSKRIEVSGAHCLRLPYESKCKKIHGHNWIIEVEVSGEYLNERGMLIDFVHIKEVVMQLDHDNINEVVGDINPTAENIAKWIADKINEKIYEDTPGVVCDDTMDIQVSKVTVQESEGNVVCYIP